MDDPFEKDLSNVLSGWSKAELYERVSLQWKYRGFTLATSLLAAIFGIAAIVLGALAYSYLQYHIDPAIIRGPGPITSSPYVFYIDASGFPAELILPNDLSDYVGKVYRVWSRTSEAHTIRIAGFGVTFNGVGSTLTFGGAVGDGVVFEVISPAFVVIHNSRNVVIS